jgi:hypothetical protein
VASSVGSTNPHPHGLWIKNWYISLNWVIVIR